MILLNSTSESGFCFCVGYCFLFGIFLMILSNSLSDNVLLVVGLRVIGIGFVGSSVKWLVLNISANTFSPVIVSLDSVGPGNGFLLCRRSLMRSVAVFFKCSSKFALGVGMCCGMNESVSASISLLVSGMKYLIHL